MLIFTYFQKVMNILSADQSFANIKKNIFIQKKI